MFANFAWSNPVLSTSCPRHSPAPPPKLVTITGIRFSATGDWPHLISLKTTTEGVEESGQSFWGHIPDMWCYWKTSRAWEWRDAETFRLENQSISGCNGLYILFYSFDLESLPENRNFPRGIYGRERAFAGDAFAFKINGSKIGEDLGENGWAVWQDVPPEILNLPVMQM